MNPKVSILIPLYNSEKYIGETIESVLVQTYTNWECIIVDDHSTDNSVEIATEYSKKYPEKIKIFKNNRKGACAARNYAFKNCIGDYIQYLDADDLLSDDKIEKQMKLLDKKNPNIVSSTQWDILRDKVGIRSSKSNICYKNYDNPLNLLVDMWTKEIMMANSVWLTHRQLISVAGIWNEQLIINQDGDFFCRVLFDAASVLFSPEGRVFYRKDNPQSITSKKITFSAACSRLESLKAYEIVLSKCDNTKVRRAIASNYLGFIKMYYPLYPELLNQAEKYFYDLGFKKKWGTGRKFTVAAKIFGFENALKLQSMLIRKNV